MELVQGEFTHQRQPRIVESIVLLFLISFGFISGSTALTGPEKVRGVVGESVTVVCQYDQKYKDYVKKWCKGNPSIGCNELVSTKQPQNGRVSMTDNKTQGIFSITMDDLMKSDDGLYQCMIERELLIRNDRFTISLEVSEAPEKETSTRSIWTTSWTTMSTRKGESTETSNVSHLIRATLSQRDLILAVALSVLFLLLITAIIVCAKLRQKKKTGTNGQRINGAENLAGNVTETAVVYSSVKHRKDDVESVYINVPVQDAPRKARTQQASETVIYSGVAH